MTTQSAASASWSNGKGFVQGGVSFLDFRNDVMAITADSPFWNTDTLASSGIKRGLWETGRGSMPPSNDSWNLFAKGGWVAGRSTQITATINRGRINQTAAFAPITTNTALIGSVDMNGDGVIDSRDDPTSTSTLAQPNLGGAIDTTMFSLVVSSRPVRAVKITGRVRMFDYDATQPLFDSGWRAEYLESRLKPDMGYGPLNHVPVDFQRNVFSVDAVLRASNQLKFVVLDKWFVRDYDQYVDTDHAVYVAHTAGTRAVDKTTDATFGAGVIFAPSHFFNGRLMYEHASRDFDGDYRRAYTKEVEGMQQFDISVRKRNTVRLDLDFMPVDVATFGVDFWYGSDDYPEAVYGVQSGDIKGVVFDVSTHAADAVNIFAFAEWSQMNTDAHLRTKCSNCTPPPGASWTTPWGVPNFDWFTNYTDTTVAFGAGVLYETDSSPYVVDLKVNYLQGVVEQLTRNPGTPLDLLNGNVATVALGHDFSDQETKTFVTELRLSRKLNDFATIGLWYLFENFDLGDFMWDSMDPYGANYLDIDDATRYLLLDARYTGYTGNVIQGFVNLEF